MRAGFEAGSWTVSTVDRGLVEAVRVHAVTGLTRAMSETSEKTRFVAALSAIDESFQQLGSLQDQDGKEIGS